MNGESVLLADVGVTSAPLRPEGCVSISDAWVRKRRRRDLMAGYWCWNKHPTITSIVAARAPASDRDDSPYRRQEALRDGARPKIEALTNAEFAFFERGNIT